MIFLQCLSLCLFLLQANHKTEYRTESSVQIYPIIHLLSQDKLQEPEHYVVWVSTNTAHNTSVTEVLKHFCH